MDFLPPGETVDSDRYLLVLARLKEAIHRKRPHLWQKDPSDPDNQRRLFVIHQDNTPSHTSAITLSFFQHIPLLAHPPYSPDLTPSDFFLFPRLKNQLASNHIRTLDELRASMHRELRRIPQMDYHEAIQQWPLRWMKCVAASGSYFEGRHYSVDPDQFGLALTFDGPEGSDSEEENTDAELD